jgi:hypothetical protein
MFEESFTLSPHPNTQQPQDQVRINGFLQRDRDLLSVRYDFMADRNVLKWEMPTTDSRQDELWQTTCAELFLKIPTNKAYWEFNFSPSGAWNAYSFTDYRTDRKPELNIDSVNIKNSIESDTHRCLVVEFSLTGLNLADQTLQCGITAVAELSDHEKFYYALTHSSEKPDFHLADSFTLNIPHQ